MTQGVRTCSRRMRGLGFVEPVHARSRDRKVEIEEEDVAVVRRPNPVVGKVLDVVIATTASFVNGALLGALVGMVSGAWQTKTWAGASAEARASARSWGGISGVYSGLQAAARAIRGVEDKYNPVIGACGSGAVFSLASGPRAALQGCASFALFSYLIEMWMGPRDTMLESSMREDEVTPVKGKRK